MYKNVYILAMGRSGTTLLQNILNAHPNVVVPPESFFVLNLYDKYKDKKKWDQSLITSFIDDLYTDRPFRLVWQISKKDILKKFELHAPISNFEEACNLVRLSFNKTNDEQVKIIGDKNPIYARFTEKIMKVHPKAKIIHMIRDPRGTANGHINTFKRKDALAVGSIWSLHNQIIESLEKKFPQNYYLLKYEDLIGKTEDTLKSLCEFLTIEFNPSMLEYRSMVNERFNDYGDKLKKKHINLLKPIDQSIADKWKQSLTKRQIKNIEYTTHDLATSYGYKFAKPKMDFYIFCCLPISKLKYRLIFRFILIYFWLPFPMRKFILAIRSTLSDHKYVSQNK